MGSLGKACLTVPKVQGYLVHSSPYDGLICPGHRPVSNSAGTQLVPRELETSGPEHVWFQSCLP